MYGLIKEVPSGASTISSEKSHRMQLVLSRDAAISLEDLKKSNGCASYGETVRRAIDFLFRVVSSVGLPISHQLADQTERMTDRVQVIIPARTVELIDLLCGKLEALGSKSETVRLALELYAQASEAQRDMKEMDIKGTNGVMKSSLAFMP